MRGKSQVDAAGSRLRQPFETRGVWMSQTPTVSMTLYGGVSTRLDDDRRQKSHHIGFIHHSLKYIFSVQSLVMRFSTPSSWACFFFPFAPLAQNTALCEGQQYDVDGDFVVGVGDILSVLSWFGTVLDADEDGTLDCNDDCVGAYDECGICNGPGPQIQVLDTIIITYDSIYVEAINDWVTYELGNRQRIHPPMR